MEMHSLTSSSFIICLWGETFGSRTILFQLKIHIENKLVLLSQMEKYIKTSENQD